MLQHVRGHANANVRYDAKVNSKLARKQGKRGLLSRGKCRSYGAMRRRWAAAAVGTCMVVGSKFVCISVNMFDGNWRRGELQASRKSVANAERYAAVGFGCRKVGKNGPTKMRR